LDIPSVIATVQWRGSIWL